MQEKTYSSMQESLLRGFFIGSICAAIPAMILSFLFAETKANYNITIMLMGVSVNTVFYLYCFKHKKKPLKFLSIFLVTITVTSYIFAYDRMPKHG